MLGRFFDDILISGNRKLSMPSQYNLKCLCNRLVQSSIIAVVFTMGANSASAQCEVQKLLASNGHVNDKFGFSMKFYNDMLFIGSPRQNSINNKYDIGAVNIFLRDGSEWVEEAILYALDGIHGDLFGLSVDTDSNIVIVGAPDVDGEPPVQNLGAAYIFRFDTGKSLWTQEAKLAAPDAAHADLLGISVGISGNVAVAGAHGDDDNAQSAGAAYVFTYDGSEWSDPIKLLASDGAEDDLFGFSVAIDGDVIIVGAPFKNGIDSWSGATYIFRFNPKTQIWDEEAKLVPSDTALLDIFGHSVSIYGDDVLIGSTEFASKRPGKAYIFHYDGKKWIETAKFTDQDGGINDLFGHKVDLADGVAIIGAPEHDAAGEDSGAAYIYKLHPETEQWNFHAKLTASDANEGEQFGFGVAVGQNTLAMGAIFDDDLGENSGSAYVFDLDGENCKPPPICPWDLDGSGSVGTTDLLALFAQWGTAGPADFDGSGVVNTSDLLILFANWGLCP